MADRDLLDELNLKQKDDPVLEGIGKIAAHSVELERKTNAKIKDVESRVDEVKGEVEKTEKRVTDKMEDGFGLVKDYLGRIEKRQSALGHFRAEDITDPLLSAMSESRRKSIHRYEHVAAAAPKGSKLSDPILAAATDQWFKHATVLQLTRMSSQHQERHAEFAKLNQAFADVVKAGPLTEGTSAEGGYTVPTIVENEILRLILDAGDIFPLCRRVQMTANTHAFPREDTGVSCFWVNEETTIDGTDSEPVFGQVNLVAQKLAANATMSIELLEDSNVAVLPYLQSVYAEKFARELDAQVMEGDGAPGFTGINGTANVNAIDAVASGTAGAAPTYANLVATFVKGGEKSTRNNGVWVMHPGVFGNVAGMVDSNGQPILKLGDAAGTLPMSIFGRPVIVSNALTVGTTATITPDVVGNIYFGPPDKLLAGYRSGLRWDVSDAPNWATYRIDARMIGRFAFAVGVPAAWTRYIEVHAD